MGKAQPLGEKVVEQAGSSLHRVSIAERPGVFFKTECGGGAASPHHRCHSSSLLPKNKTKMEAKSHIKIEGTNMLLKKTYMYMCVHTCIHTYTDTCVRVYTEHTEIQGKNGTDAPFIKPM